MEVSYRLPPLPYPPPTVSPVTTVFIADVGIARADDGQAKSHGRPTRFQVSYQGLGYGTRHTVPQYQDQDDLMVADRESDLWPLAELTSVRESEVSLLVEWDSDPERGVSHWVAMDSDRAREWSVGDRSITVLVSP